MPSITSEDVCKCKVNGRSWEKRNRNFKSIRNPLREWRKRRRPSCDNQTIIGKSEIPPRLKSKKYKSTADGNPATYKPNHGCSPSYKICQSPCSSSPPRLPIEQQVTADDEKFMSSTEQARVDKSRYQCWIQRLPQEIILLIFSYLPLATLLLVIPYVCKKWRELSMDWSLWKRVEHLRIKTMIVNTTDVRTLLRTIPRLKELELVLRNDTEEVLEELFKASDHLEVLRLDRCTHTLPGTFRSILYSCPKLKSVTFVDTHFRSKEFYKYLAEKFKSFERINISCTTKSEMDIFMDNLKRKVPGVEFQTVSMMGKADGKQIYWGPILGLVIRPNPTSPYHRRHTNDFPNYAF